STHPNSARSGRDHLLLDADAGGTRALVLERNGGRVLERDSRRVEEGDLVVRRTPFDLADDHLADLARDVGLRNQSLRERHVDLAVGPALADVVDEDPRSLQDPPVQLLVAALVG